MTDDPTDLALREYNTPPTIGITPRTPEEIWRWANLAAKSRLVPTAYFNKPHDVLVAIQMGSEVGLPPMTALQNIDVVNGRPGVYGAALLAIVRASPVFDKIEEYYEVTLDDGKRYQRRRELAPEELANPRTRAVCTVWRKGDADPTTKSFSMAQAKTANLLKKENYQLYADRMILMRARKLALDDKFPDVVKGILTVEELRELPPELLQAAPPPEGKTVQRKSATPPAGKWVQTDYSETVTPPEPEPITIVAGVRRLEHLRAHTEISLTTGQVVEVAADAEDAHIELLKFAEHPEVLLRILVRPVGDRLQLVDFRLAE
jgi:hypothetical protein